MTGLLAYVDESCRETGNGLMYVVGAAVILRSDEPRARRVLEDLRLPGQRYLHWQAESDERRHLLLDAIADLGFVAFVVASHPVTRRRQERARARTLKKLAFVLSREEGISSVVIESRTSILDRRDAAMFGEARSLGTLGPGFQFRHAAKSEDPLLWAADIVTSAQALDLATAGHPFWEPLRRVIVGVHQIGP